MLGQGYGLKMSISLTKHALHMLIHSPCQHLLLMLVTGTNTPIPLATNAYSLPYASETPLPVIALLETGGTFRSDTIPATFYIVFRATSNLLSSTCAEGMRIISFARSVSLQPTSDSTAAIIAEFPDLFTALEKSPRDERHSRLLCGDWNTARRLRSCSYWQRPCTMMSSVMSRQPGMPRIMSSIAFWKISEAALTPKIKRVKRRSPVCVEKAVMCRDFLSSWSW